MLEPSIYALLHLLVFVYWLGGDLGAFYASHFLTAPNISAERRLFAAQIVGNVDMAPRTALILAFPTGLLLGIETGWIELARIWGWLALGLSLLWLALAWHLHLEHAASAPFRLFDSLIRWVMLATMLGAGVAGVAGLIPLALFVSLKLVLLAFAIAMGLMIRQVLKPLGPALAGLSGEASTQSETQLAATLGQARPLVVLIWVAIIAAAFLGLWRPTGF